MKDREVVLKSNMKVKMYVLLPIFLLIANCQLLLAQSPPDSVLKKYNAATGFSDKCYSLFDYLDSSSKNDSTVLKKSLELLYYFQNKNDAEGLNYMHFVLGYQFSRKKDYNTSLNYCLKALSGFKESKDTAAILATNMQIGYTYGDAMNNLEALNYFKDNLRITLARGDKPGSANQYNMLGTIYAVMFRPDSGLVYAQEGLNIAYELKDYTTIAILLGTVAENYIAKGDYDLALSFLRKSEQYQAKIINAESGIPYQWIYNDYAQAYLGMKEYDSTLYYSHRSLRFSIPKNDLVQQLRSSTYLFKSYDALNRQDSAFKYFRLMTALKDSISSTENVKAIEATTFREALRKQELELQKIKSDEEHDKNVQYALIAVGIVSFLLLFFLLSRSIIVSEKWISFFGILGLLIVFEFINLLIHPFLERVTHHSPFLMLFALVGIASLLIPLHHRIEKWIKEKMTEKNKRIRLENAKKTIEELEGSLNDT
jgi:tetratricopeptide (TPR) repeat protein